MIDLGVILAGGQGRRLGGLDKARVTLGGEALHEIAAGKISGLCRLIVVVAPDKPDWADAAGIGFVPDATGAGGHALGPAGGLLGAVRSLASQAPEGRLVTVPVDAPFFPASIVSALLEGQGDHPGAVARANGRLQPVFGVWSASILEDLEHLVLQANERALHRIVDRLGAAVIDIGAGEDAFLNINTPEDLARARILAGKA
ncbi:MULTISPECIES: molybdenum cofactor guanylyltransferase [unclassified Hyphomonas]|uniref:molybdenum cofactor guanylyltransferase n=1 Tax=unclassified Hyphomonas TaxID=2630699 RepID=UPI0004591851|nr:MULTISPECIES: molybdenum cofactor guanylyltransferase [unclassified Hyphomonas]KCZ46659.1 hypothetical protein HY17_07900 [Hyphomonas sp. CY54-11-8]